jgi:hypothetical protein
MLEILAHSIFRPTFFYNLFYGTADPKLGKIEIKVPIHLYIFILPLTVPSGG